MHRFMMSALASLFVLTANAANTDPVRRSSDAPTLILIGLDGFRWDLMDKVPTPNLHRLAAGGVRSEMIPVWPSLTYPNFWALATGLYPGHSGIVANEMYDPELKESYGAKSFKDSRWWLGEPIWATVEKQGGTAGVTSWPGAESTEGAGRPTYLLSYRPFIARQSWQERADMVLDLLDLPDKVRPTFLTLYSADVDDNEHTHGPDSKQAKAAIGRIDAMIGRLMTGLAKRKLHDKVDIIVVADHGHMGVAAGSVIEIDDYIDLDTVNRDALGGGPMMSVWPTGASEDALYGRLANAHPHLHVFRKSELPARYHTGDAARTAPLVVTADPGWVVCKRDDKHCTDVKGMHGYDNALRDMHPLFIARGPAIRAGSILPAFENVHVYSLMTHILGLRPAKTDGQLTPFCKVLAAPPPACDAQ